MGHAHVRSWSAVCSECWTWDLVKEGNPFMHGQIELPNTNLKAIEINPSRLAQVHSNRHGPGPGYVNTELRNIYSQGLGIQGKPRKMLLVVTGWMHVYRWSIRVGRSHSVTISKESFRTLSKRQV